MKYQVLLKVLAALLACTALTMSIPLVAALVFGENEMLAPFLLPLATVLVSSSIIILMTKKYKISFTAADGFLIVFLAWVCICLMGSVPYVMSGCPGGFSGAFFESVSGFTTTGATVFVDVEALPRSLLLWRAMTHWLGGMGIVVISVVLLPLLGAGGFQLIRAEASGSEKDRITPKITTTAKLLWLLYVALTVFNLLLLRLGGMNWFESVLHAFSTMASGGFSSRNQSIAAYHSPYIEWVTGIFMLLASFNFSLIYRLLRGKIGDLLHNSEARAYGLIILVSVSLITFSLLSRNPSGGIPAGGNALLLGGSGFEPALRQAVFHTASILSTTGFSAGDFNLWPPLARACLFFLMFTGGCSGSTAGGIKVIRYVVLCRQAGNEMKKLLYPRGVFSVQLNKKAGRKDLVYGAAAFVFLYFVMVFAAALLVSSAGFDVFSSLNAALLSLGNIGLGQGIFGPGSAFTMVPGYVRWGLSFIMIAGRLELWTALVFFSREYWRQ
ncbi:MAG: TrkH family potassium uptake protein [Spirochaetaceae bacterium]|jgi:trk system potassium uptake protein TrkH|nr:TrkH family potassium uptake protein [Spirochaetaceae bacterium]